MCEKNTSPLKGGNGSRISIVLLKKCWSIFAFEGANLETYTRYCFRRFAVIMLVNSGPDLVIVK